MALNEISVVHGGIAYDQPQTKYREQLWSIDADTAHGVKSVKLYVRYGDYAPTGATIIKTLKNFSDTNNKEKEIESTIFQLNGSEKEGFVLGKECNAMLFEMANVGDKNFKFLTPKMVQASAVHFFNPHDKKVGNELGLFMEGAYNFLGINHRTSTGKVLEDLSAVFQQKLFDHVKRNKVPLLATQLKPNNQKIISVVGGFNEQAETMLECKVTAPLRKLVQNINLGILNAWQRNNGLTDIGLNAGLVEPFAEFLNKNQNYQDRRVLS